MTRRVLAIAASVMADAARRKVPWIIVVFAAVMAVAIPDLPVYGLGVARQVFRDFAQALMYVGALLLALTLAANRVPGELERRTVYNVLSRDVRRWHYLLGSWLGVYGVLACAMAAFVASAQLVALVVYGDPMWVLWEGGLAILLEAGVVAAFATAVSTLVGPVTVTVAAAAFVFAMHVVGQFAEAVSIPALRWVPSLEVFNVLNAVSHGTGIGWARAAAMAISFAAWVAVCLLAGSVAFAGRDL